MLILLPSFVFAGTAYYVDFSASLDGDGSFSNPWNNTLTVNKHRFDKGDDVYFKANSTYVMTSDAERLQIDWSGTATDRVIIGCYDGRDDFDCGATPLVDGNRPIIDGDKNKYPGSNQGAIEIKGQSYVTVQDIKVQYTKNIISKSNQAIKAYPGSDHIIINNCYIYRVNGAAIGVYQTDTAIISNNYVAEAGYPDYTGVGAAIEASSLAWGENWKSKVGLCKNITVTRNKVINSKHEGIGFYKGVTNSVMEYNVVRDIKSFMLYIGDGKYNAIRYNLAYETSDKVHKSFNEKENAIVLQSEKTNGFEWSGYNEVYGNMVAGVSQGITLSCEIQKVIPGAVCNKGSKVYNNTLVDNTFNFATNRLTPDNDIKIENNISWTISSKTNHIFGGESPAGVDWSNNFFDDGVAGKAGNNQLTGNPDLLKSSGWRNLKPDALTGNEFSPQSGSMVLKGGKTIPGAFQLIEDADLTGAPIRVIVKPTGPSEIPLGAWRHSGKLGGSLLGGSLLGGGVVGYPHPPKGVTALVLK